MSLSIISIVHAQTSIPAGDVSGTWTKSHSPYHVMGNLRIPHDSTLLIEPGATIQFQGNYELKVMGRLFAEGTEADTILFTVNDTTGFYMEDTTLGGWKGIRIYDIDHSNDSTRLAHCRLEYGKAIGSGWNHNAGGALYVFDFDKVSVSHCLFVQNKVCTYNDIVSSGGAVAFEYSNIRFTGNTFSNNKAYRGGAVYFHASDPVFKNNLFIHNHCGWEGGGVSGGGGSNPAFWGDVFRYNHSGEMGGALMLYGPSSLNLDQVSVLENSANWAGGLGFVGCEAEIKNTTISNNLASWMGGGIASDASTISIENSLFENDSSTHIAGGIHLWQGSLRLHEVSLTGNRASAGGGINADWSHIVLDQSQFIANFADGGGGLHLFNCHLQMDSCLLDGNTALTDAGAIDYAVDSLVFDSLFVCTIASTQIINNRAGRAAGGMSIQQTHTGHPMLDLQIDSCVVSDNIAHHAGGFRIMRCTKPLVISNSIIAGNRVEAWTGGGTVSNQSQGSVYNCLFLDNHSATVNTGATTGGLGVSHTGTKVNINHCTFFANHAGRGGGLQVYRGGNAIVNNSIFWENRPEQLAVSSVFDSLPCKLTLNYNDIQYGLDSIRITDTVSTVIFGEGNMDADPHFVDSTRTDFHLMDTSPLLGAGMDSIVVEGIGYHSPPFDMEGNPRPGPFGSRPDMGAYENTNARPVGIDKHRGAGSDSFVFNSYPNPFRHSINFAFNLPVQSHVQMEVFNLSGELIQVMSRNLEQGVHHVNWRPEQEGNHLFFYRIRIQTISNQVFTKTGKMLRIH